MLIFSIDALTLQIHFAMLQRKGDEAVKENRYSIGHFSKLLGINTDTIRYYEKEGILAIRRDANKYRYFTDLDCRCLMMCRTLRSFGLSLKEVKELLAKGGAERFIGYLNGRISDIDARLNELYEIRDNLTEYLDAAKGIQEGVGKCELIEKPYSAYFFQQTLENTLIDSRDRDDMISVLSQKMPFAAQSAVLSKEALIRGRQEKDELRFGLVIEECFLGPDVDCNGMDEHFSWNLCARTVVKGQYISGLNDHAKLLLPLKQFIGARDCEIDGPAVGRLIPVEYGEGFSWHIQYNIPVKRINYGI